MLANLLAIPLPAPAFTTERHNKHPLLLGDLAHRTFTLAHPLPSLYGSICDGVFAVLPISTRIEARIILPIRIFAEVAAAEPNSSFQTLDLGNGRHYDSQATVAP